MSFSSDKNKGLLWNLMYEGGVFANIPNEAVSKVKELFENKIAQLDMRPGNVLEKNKQAMMEMVKDVESLWNEKNTSNVGWCICFCFAPL